jgi:hypothetical protein
MAFCPKCNGEMGMMDRVCPKCGYDFPSPKLPREAGPEGLAFSPLGDIALMVGQVITALQCVIAVLFAVYSLFTLHPIQSFVSIVSAFLSLALLVVFTRVQDIGKRRI